MNTPIAKIILSDESSNEVILKEQNVQSASFGKFRFEINPSTNNVEVYGSDDLDGTGSSTSVDVSSLINKNAWHLKLYCSISSAGSLHLNVANVRTIDDSSNGTAVITPATTSTSSTVTNAILVVNKDLTETDVSATYYMTADGSNYEEVTPNEIHRFTNTGTSLGVKVELNSNGDTNFAYLYEYAIKYNLY